MSTLKEAAIQGLGVVALPAYTCRQELNSGQLERLLTDWHAGMAQLSLLQPSRTGVSPPVEALRSFLLAELADFVTTGSDAEQRELTENQSDERRSIRT
jgi:DNA-binding transcriptional LysR family regulator